MWSAHERPDARAAGAERRKPLTKQIGIPDRIEDIDAAWLTAALSEWHPGVEVDQVEVVEVIQGSATKVRLRLRYSRADGLPERMILKAGFDDFMRALAAPLYCNEATFFRVAAPALRIPLVRCFYAGVEDASGQAALLLEDLVASGATFGRMEDAASPAVVAELVDQLAVLHATFWGRTDAPEVAALGKAAAGQRVVLDFLLGADNWQHCVDLGRFDSLPAAVHDRRRVAAAVFATLDGDGPTCLIHGDAHLGNVWLDRAGSPALLDWQAAGPGRWANDVPYLVIGALATEHRRHHERDLVARYVERLAAAGVADAPTPDEAWAEYRRHAVYGMLGLLCTPEMQSESFCRAMGGRFAAAVDDLGALAV